MKRKQIEYMILRPYLGAKQVISHPYFGIPIIATIALPIAVWCNKDRLIPLHLFPEPLRPALQYCLSALLILSLIVFTLGWLGGIGILTARHDESCLMKAFAKNELRNGCPILIFRKKAKGTDVTARVFYSHIPLKYWIEREEEIADQFNVHFVRLPDYGGKNNNNRKLILIHTAPGKNPKDRGILYDEEL